VAVVRRYRDLSCAEVASASLRAEGIENSLVDAYTVGLIWTYSTALGWIRLTVEDRRLEEADELLESTGAVDWPIEIVTDPAEQCPVCGSEDLAIESGARKTLALALLTVVPIRFWRSRLRCRSCGGSWVVPFTFRPDLLMVWLISALATMLTVVVVLLAGSVIAGRH
jgi:hypothetical protein